jgi:DNA-binding MurR/RpiR family transcriptional regulator
MVDKYNSRGSHLNEDEKKIVNYIISKKSPVYGFVKFLHEK